MVMPAELVFTNPRTVRSGSTCLGMTDLCPIEIHAQLRSPPEVPLQGSPHWPGLVQDSAYFDNVLLWSSQEEDWIGNIVHIVDIHYIMEVKLRTQRLLNCFPR